MMMMMMIMMIMMTTTRYQVRVGWLRGATVERWSLTGEFFMSCARPSANGVVVFNVPLDTL